LLSDGAATTESNDGGRARVGNGGGGSRPSLPPTQARALRIDGVRTRAVSRMSCGFVGGAVGAWFATRARRRVEGERGEGVKALASSIGVRRRAGCFDDVMYGWRRS
jgi:hypothetical protein